MSRQSAPKRLKRRHMLAISALVGLLSPSLEPEAAHASTEYRTSATLKYYNTPHFRVIYDAADSEWVARHIGELAEQIRVEVLQTLELPDPGRFDLLLMDNYDNANGSASGYPLNVIRLYLNGAFPPVTGSSDLSDAMGETWLRELITHEYTHGVHLNYLTGWTRLYKYLFHSSPLGLVYPSWFVEGLATAVETHNSSRGRAKTVTSDMILRTAILEDEFLPMGLWDSPTRWPRGGARYLYGGAFLHYVDKRFGPGSLKRIMDAANRQLPLVDDVRLGPLKEVMKAVGVAPETAEAARLGGLERAFRLAVGIPLSQVVKEFKQSLTLRYVDEARAIREAGVTRAERLSAEEGSSRSAAVSPDGRLVAYVGGGDNELRGLYAVPVQGGRPVHLLTRDDIFGGVQFTSQGDHLVYARLLGKESPLDRSEAQTDLFTLDMRTRQETRLTKGQRLRDPAVSPDGRFMVAVQTGKGKTRLIRLEPDGSSPVELFDPDITYQLSQPSISPDGRIVALSVYVQQDPPKQALYQVGLFDLDSGTFRLLPGPGTQREASWLDATHLIYSSDRSGIYNLYATDIRDGSVRPVTNMLTGAFQPLVARSAGEPGAAPTIIFRAYSPRGFGIYRLEPTQYETLALMDAAPNRRVPSIDAHPLLEPGQAFKPETPEEFKISNIQIAAPETSAPVFRPLTGLRMSSIMPVLEGDEGGASSLAGGYTLGLRTTVVEPLDRHRFSAEVTYGLSSQRPSWSVAYLNQTLNFPVFLFAEESAYAVDLVPEGADSYLVWERPRGGGLQLGLPWTRGDFYAELGGTATLAATERNSLASSQVSTGRSTTQSLYLSLGTYTSNTWRSPVQGHFLDLSLSHRQRWTDPNDATIEGLLLKANYTGRIGLGWGNLDVDLTGGQATGSMDNIRIGGFSGSWALPGVASSKSIRGPLAVRGLLSLSQDLWRPELVLGALPSLYLERVEAFATAGIGVTSNTHFELKGVAQGLGAGVTFWGAAIRNGISLAPTFQVGYNLSSSDLVYTFSLTGTPGLSAASPRLSARKQDEPFTLPELW